MKQKLIVVCGPTAVGKTSCALRLAALFGGELLSADSRQVYRGMNIGTGKDIPEGFQYCKSDLVYKNYSIGYYTNNRTRIWGYDLSDPSYYFSVADYILAMQPVLSNIWARSLMPIIVGGTGHYINSLLNPPETVGVPQNRLLRSKLESMHITDLQAILSGLDASLLTSMNNSDIHNPRRLIRAIEVAQSTESSREYIDVRTDTDVLKIGLTVDWQVLDDRIERRVRERYQQGMLQEVLDLESSYADWSAPSFSATGYRQIRSYLKEEISLDKALEDWATSEKQYARRQMTWFRKTNGIKWYDRSRQGFTDRIVGLVKNWYA